MEMTFRPMTPTERMYSYGWDFPQHSRAVKSLER